ncbi:MAG: hypothetical protein QXK12_07290 [Candidatus Nezhaarchaeales archaeon]
MSKVVERRLRVRRMEGVENGSAKINPKAAQFLGITDLVEVVLVGKRRFRFKAVLSEATPTNEVWINPGEALAYGIADNSIATIRRPLKA